MTHYGLKSIGMALFVMTVSLSAHAATPTPDAGSILQQVAPTPAPAPAHGDTGLTIEQAGGTPLPASAPFAVKTIRLSGNQAIDTATLHALVAEAEGKPLTLPALNALAGRITAYYRQHGYPLARAIIPPQTIQDGVVTIQVIEARYDRIRLDNRSRVNTPLLRSTLAPLRSGATITQTQLNQRLLLLSDIPGVLLNATMKPGAAVGTSDLTVETTPGAAVSGSVVADNYGSRYTGRARLGASVNFINPLHHGDVLTLSGLDSGQKLNYGRIAYETLLSGEGTRVGGAWSLLKYKLGGTLASLHAHGSAESGSLWAKHPFVRRQRVNLRGQLRYEHLQLRDRIDTSSIRTDRHLDNGVLSLSGDIRDGILGGGVNSWRLGWTLGRVSFDDVNAEQADASTAQTRGRFSKWSAQLVRQQRLGQASSLYLSLSGQWSHDNLDASQKLTVGGPYSVRAYDTGAVSGDSGYQGTLELRQTVGGAWHGRWQAVAFFDGAQVRVNAVPWSMGNNHATLTGAGVGLNWTGARGWHARAYVAATTGTTPELVGRTDDSRGWVEIGKGF